MSEEPARKTISLPAGLYATAEMNARRRGFASSFSAYVAWLIERDQHGDVTRETLADDPDGKVIRMDARAPVNYGKPRRKKRR